MNQTASLKIEDRILEACQRGNIDIPTLPDIALKVRDAVNDPNKGLNQIAKFLEMDPNIAANVIKIANSSMFTGYRLTSSCMEAVARLGLHVVQNIVICIAVNNMFATPNHQIKQQLSKILDKSRRIGAISYVIGSIVKGKQAEKAMLGGLISQIGTLPVISYLSRIPEVSGNQLVIERIINKISGQVGRIVLEKWNFDEELISIPENFDNWFKDDKPKSDYADIIIVANIHSMYGNTQQSKNIPHLVDIPAFKKLGISKLGPQASLEILHEAQEDIRQAAKMLAL